MYAVGRLSSYISQGVYTVSAPFHPFGGAVDIIVVQQQDGSFKSSPWYVKFGKFQGVLKTKEKIVNININGVDADFSMYLDHKGEAYFLKELDGEECESTSSSSDDTDGKSQNGRIRKSKSYAFDAKQPNLNAQIDVGSGTIVTRTNSRRSKIFGLMFGRKSMKEDSMQREGSDHDTVNRVSSLERAEIAADLLDVKWSTNLSNGIPNKDKVSRLSTTDVSAQDIDKDLQVNDKEIRNNILLDDCLDNYFDHSDFQKATGVSHEEATNSSGSSIGNGKFSNGASSPGAPCARSEKLDESMMEASVSGEKFEVVPETSAGPSVFDDLAERENDFISEIIVPCVENPHLSKLDGHPSMQQDMKRVPDEWVQSFTVAIPNEESGNFYIYSETPESSKVDFDVSDEKGIVAFDCSCGECEVTLDKLESGPEWASVIDELRVSNNEDSGEFSNTKATCLSKGNSISVDTKSIVTDSHFSYDIHLLTSEYGEAGMLKIFHQETMTERLTEDKDSDTKSVVGFEELSRTPGSHVQVVSVNQLLHSIDEAEQQGICISSSIRNLISLVQEENYLGEENELNTLHNVNSLDGDPQGSSVEHILTETIIAPPESSGDDQFLFSDIDDFKVSGVRYDYSGLSDSMDREYDPLVSMDSIQESQGSNDMNFESDMTSVKHFQECSLTSEHVTEKSRSTSSPMSIPKSRKSDVDEVERMIESLPSFRSHINDLERSNLFHSLSQSLDSHSENSKWGVVGKDIISSSKSVSDTEQHLTEEDLTVDDIRTWEELKNMSPDSTVEISLCKHLLYVGMGADAASLAFESEKLDLEKFVSLGPGIVKSDKLIVRIGSQYFPWDAAAPIILGMITFGEDQIVPEGMISVDQVNNTGEGEQSRAAVPSGGSWRLWPFNFKRASTINSVQPAPESIIVSASANASESSNNVTENNTPQKVKVARKNVKSLVPTSEQLATLNLKDGQNVVTFTFSTAMLGKQQVDARIYLWKWNTRIVISDVDGTITKSDVLGQFMPLVGKDWSQTGVAHLFSAIKENGYQLLFLSARAISQAYLTRQFLFNLKQDGKALPDGPVVISPDGLFPSLYREVIRRAPHEFKIACLKDIKDLFPPDCNPFYAGFGNRDTDEFSYLKVGIPKGKIFIINAKGEVSVNRRVDRKSYTSLHALVNGMFPATSSAEQEEFNSWNYWRTPLPDIDF